jgi:hypothetical protein
VSSINRTPQGGWRARYRDPAGRSRSRTFGTKVEARRFLDATNTDMHRGQWVDPATGRVTLAEWAATYLGNVTNLRPTTLATYERDLARYVLPHFGHLPLARIRPLDVRSWLADELAAGIASAGLVFPNRAGKPIATSSFNTAHWKPAKRQAALDRLRWHDLRHTAVALAIAQGAHPKAIQARLGHSSVQVTLDRYGHLFPELDAAIADGLEGTFRASLRLIPGGADEAAETPARDTARTQMTRGRHKIGASDGNSRSPADKTKSVPDQGEHSEAASGIEPLYRVSQTPKASIW